MLGKEPQKKTTNLTNLTNLTNKQEAVFDYLLKNADPRNNIRKLVRNLEKEGIYTRFDFAKKALKALDRNQYIPFGIEGEELVAKEIKCYCGSKISPLVFKKTDGKCPKCKRRLIALKGSGLEII